MKRPFFVDPLICMSSEEIALCLYKICRKPFRTKRIEVTQCRRKTERRDAVGCKRANDRTPRSEIFIEDSRKFIVEQEIFERSVFRKCRTHFFKQRRADDTSATPNASAFGEIDTVIHCS